MLTKARANINTYISNWKRKLTNRDFNWILDQVLVISPVFSVLFILIYKVSIRLEQNYFSTSSLVLPDEIKTNLPFAYFLFLCFWIIAKYSLSDSAQVKADTNRRGNHILLKIKSFVSKIQTERIYTVALILILIISIFIKLPYFNLPFVGSHPMKYNTYAEPAFNMYEKGDPLFFKRNYMYNPLNPSTESAKLFGNLPAMEWSLFLGYSALGGVLSIEVITRLVTSLWGALSLYTLYLFIQKFINKKVAIATIVLLAFNSIFNLASYVTVYEIITFPLTFISLSLLINSTRNINEQNRSLSLSAILIGLGASIKANILIWSLPAVLIMLAFQFSGNYNNIVKRFGYYLIWVLVPMIFVRFSLSYLPSKEYIYFLSTILGLILIVAAYLKQQYLHSLYTKVIDVILKVLTRKKFLYLFIVILLITGLVHIYQSNLGQEFLTDPKLLFNSEMYKRMLSEQLIPYTDFYLFTIFIYSLPTIIKSLRVNKLYPLLAIFIGVFIYVIVASKSLFFHNYYWIIVLAPVYTLISLGIFNVSQYIRKSWIRILFIVLLIGSSIMILWPDTTGKVNRNDKDIKSLVEYFNSQNLEEGVSYIDQANSAYIIFKTNINTIYSTEIFDREEFKERVREFGFIETMQYYKILYIVAYTETGADYLPLANAFDYSNEISKNSLDRSSIITQVLTEKGREYTDKIDREQIIRENKVKESYCIIHKFGRYTVYKVDQSCKLNGGK